MRDFDEYLTEIYKRSHIPINSKDPIVALYYLLLIFEEDLLKVMEEQRRQLISALELEQEKWQKESKGRAELIIEKSLELSHKQSIDVFNSQTVLICKKINEIFDARIDELKMIDTRLSILGKLNLLCMGGIILFFCSILIFF